MRIFSLLIGFFCLSAFGLQAKEAEVKYQLEIIDADHHLAKVTVKFPRVNADSFIIKLPNWRTGKYKILNFASNVSELQAFDENKKPLLVNKKDKSSWKVALNKASAITISYQLYANQLASRTLHIDDTHMFLDAASGLIYSDNFRESPVKVNLKVPRKWQSRSGMKKIAKHAFEAANYDQLVDSPIETGIHEYREFKVNERQYELIIWGEGNYDSDAIIEDLKKLDGAAKQFWGGFPFKRYVYMVHLAPGLRGATEHLNSTIISSSPYRFAKRKDYLGFAQIVAHEFVHTWNVKQYKPAGITPYDYEIENYSSLFWMAEGSTSYIQNLIGVRAGTITLDEFLASFADSINSYMHKPGRKRMSVAQSSFDTWIGDVNDDYLNNTVSIYQEGKLVTFILDYKIRSLTDNKKSIEDLHRRLYQDVRDAEVSNYHGYTESDVLALLKEITGTSFEPFWQDYVRGTKQLPITQALDFFGLAFEESSEQKLNWSGLKVEDFNGFAKVSSVERDSPAWKSGLVAGDIIISYENQQATGTLLERFTDYRIGKSLKLHFFRKNLLKQTAIKLIKNPIPKQKIVPKDSVSSTISDFFKSWTGQDLPTPSVAE